jgi:hypothetical protein
MENEPKIERRGGKRPNSGAKPKYAERTMNITYRVPISHAGALKEIIEQYLKKLLIQKPKSDANNTLRN